MNEQHVHDAQEMALSFGGVLRTMIDLPGPEGDLFEHVLTGICWCQPLIEEVPPDGRLFIHRASLDSPHIERPA